MGLNPAENNEYLMAIKIRRTTSDGGEVKSSVPCRDTCGMSENPTGVKRDTS
jgi:hypothetical protein